MSRNIRIRTPKVRLRLGGPAARKEILLSPQKKCALKSQIEEATAVLTGKILWSCHHAADLAAFTFGERWTVADRRGRLREVGEFALHVRCAWRLAQNDRTLAGSAVSANGGGSQAGARITDFGRDGSRAREVLPALFNGGRSQIAVETVAVGDGGSLHLSLSEDMWLVIEPDRSSTREHWRFFGYNTGPHLVMTGKGLES